MNRGEQLLRGAGVAQQVAAEWKPYEWGGRAGWNPALLGKMPTVAQERAARAEKFARLRDEEGLSVREAAAAVGLAADTGRSYERRRRAAGAA